MNARRKLRKSNSGEARSWRSASTIGLIFGVALVTFIAGYGITALAYTSGGAPADVVLVPDLRELPLADANRRLGDANLSLTVGDSLPNMAVAAGSVLAQSPLPGQEVSPGTEVRVILSTGQHRPRVPDVEAMPLALATRAIEAAGFQVEIEEAPGEGPQGRVLSTTPSGGTPVPLPASVVIRVGAAAPLTEMPSLIGMSEEEARELLLQVELNVTEVLYESVDGIAPYQVIHQTPSPGEPVEAGGSVRLRVSLPVVLQSGADRPSGALPARPLVLAGGIR